MAANDQQFRVPVVFGKSPTCHGRAFLVFKLFSSLPPFSTYWIALICQSVVLVLVFFLRNHFHGANTIIHVVVGGHGSDSTMHDGVLVMSRMIYLSGVHSIDSMALVDTLHTKLTMHGCSAWWPWWVFRKNTNKWGGKTRWRCYLLLWLLLLLSLFMLSLWKNRERMVDVELWVKLIFDISGLWSLRCI